MSRGRWSEQCVVHYDNQVDDFFNQHFRESERNCLVIGGAGFDPRSAQIIKSLSKVLNTRLDALMLKEERPDPDPKLVARANANLELIRQCCPNTQVESVEIFAQDNAVIAGHNVIRVLQSINFSLYTDVVLDLSALSLGVSYPIASYLYQFAENHKLTKSINVHLAILSNPSLDQAITSESNDVASRARGFDILDLYGESDKAILWLPVLSEGKENLLQIIHTDIKPYDTCPILPFPTEDPRKGDRIAYSIFNSIRSDFGGPLDNDWSLDLHSFLYSDERKPLDIYRSILRIADERELVFQAFGGSTLILSPVGSKVPAIGALMAALERNFPVVYVESVAYNVNWQAVDGLGDGDSRMTHVWLCGDAYLNDVS